MALKDVSLTQSDGRLLVDGTEVSRHRELKEALEAGLPHLDADPQPSVEYHPAPVRFSASRVTEATTTEPEPEPEPEPSGTVALTLDARWETALGTSDAALLDGGEWDSLTCSDPGQLLEVIDGSEVGLSGYNVLRVESRGEACGACIKNPVSDRLQSVYARMYLRNDATSSRTWAHGIAHDYIGDIDISFGIWVESDGEWRIRINPADHTTLGQISFEASGDGNSVDSFANGVWKRFEYHIDWQNDGEYKLYARLYDDQGTLTHDTGDWWHTDVGESIESANSLGNFAVDPNSTDGPEEMREFGIGSEGPLNHPDDGEPYYTAMVAFSTEGWIGSQDGPF